MRSPNAQIPEPQTLYLEIRDLQPKTDTIKAEMGARTLAKAERHIFCPRQSPDMLWQMCGPCERLTMIWMMVRLMVMVNTTRTNLKP